MEKCPSGKRGRHHLNAVLPGEDGRPFVLFCEWCGATRHVDMDTPAPLDDLPADAIAELSRRKQ